MSNSFHAAMAVRVLCPRSYDGFRNRLAIVSRTHARSDYLTISDNGPISLFAMQDDEPDAEAPVIVAKLERRLTEKTEHLRFLNDVPGDVQLSSPVLPAEGHCTLAMDDRTIWLFADLTIEGESLAPANSKIQLFGEYLPWKSEFVPFFGSAHDE